MNIKQSMNIKELFMNHLFLYDISSIDDAFRDYILNRLLPQIGLKTSECTMEIPLMGLKSCIRFLKGPEGRGYAVRALGKRQIKEAHQLKAASDLLERHRIPSPRLIDFAEKYSSRGVTFVTEEYLNTINWEHLEPTAALSRGVGKLLARLHKAESDHWGSIIAPSRGSFGSSQFQWVKNRVHGIRKFPKSRISRSEFRRVLDWFEKYQSRLDGLRRFQLIHNKINRGNVLYSPESGELFLVDFATLQYGYRGKDLTRTEYALLKNDKNLIREFHDEYFTCFPPGTREEFERLSPFYQAYHHLSTSATNIRRDHAICSRNLSSHPNLYNISLHHWKILLQIIENEK